MGEGDEGGDVDFLEVGQEVVEDDYVLVVVGGGGGRGGEGDDDFGGGKVIFDQFGKVLDLVGEGSFCDVLQGDRVENYRFIL